ncbi:hypothetical protein PPERSA_11050 [Pseudocohnilembus persalinus]|uniref:Uncharacterized protein n=1 Tax=Pseudocohnilembus persalinus TaxID=266149 RepID=A0A0V0QZK8_PSEPJ|nr:hypothetical protein PPERSA_11050 [Pseudocohnilembus persalinus]|eukprot:KRX07501.1 hypothetical protein PPERSA_11050 [Pseudocohnilembus persalinus]
MLQCQKCLQEDPKNENIIIIQQLPHKVFQIKDTSDQSSPSEILKTQKTLQQYKKENIIQFKNTLQDKVEDYYKHQQLKINQQLQKQKKEIILQFQSRFDKIDYKGLYESKPIEELVQQFFDEKIDLDELFQQQLNIKNLQENNLKYEKVLEQEKLQKFIMEQYALVQKQMEQKFKNLEQKIYISRGEINLKQQNKFEDNPPLELNMFEQIKFFKSKYNLEEINKKIKIEKQNEQGPIQINFGYDVFKSTTQIYSEPLQKKKTYHIRIKINLNGSNRQLLIFYFLGQKNVDNLWGNQNQIIVSDIQEFQKAENVINWTKQGKDFRDILLNDHDSVLNITFNYQNGLFQISDGKQKAIIRAMINQDLIQGDLVFGTSLYQQNLSYVSYIIQDINCY